MFTVKGEYQNGQVILEKRDLPKHNMHVIVTFLDGDDAGQVKSGAKFVEKWRGFLKGANLDQWREDRIDHLERKHS